MSNKDKQTPVVDVQGYQPKAEGDLNPEELQPPTEEPVVSDTCGVQQEITITILDDNSVEFKTAPERDIMAVLGLLMVIVRRLGG